LWVEEVCGKREKFIEEVKKKKKSQQDKNISEPSRCIDIRERRIEKKSHQGGNTTSKIQKEHSKRVSCPSFKKSRPKIKFHKKRKGGRREGVGF